MACFPNQISSATMFASNAHGIGGYGPLCNELTQLDRNEADNQQIDRDLSASSCGVGHAVGGASGVTAFVLGVLTIGGPLGFLAGSAFGLLGYGQGVVIDKQEVAKKIDKRRFTRLYSKIAQIENWMASGQGSSSQLRVAKAFFESSVCAYQPTIRIQ